MPPLREHDVNVRSHEVQEIFDKIPAWITRWGITVLFGVVIFGLILSWFVRYPDIINSRVLLTTKTPPARLVTRQSGRLLLFTTDNSDVKKNNILAIIDNAANETHILELAALCETANSHIEASTDYFDTLSLGSNLQLGELQNNYMAFYNSIKNFQLAKNLRTYDQQAQAVRNSISKYRLMARELEKQKELSREEFALAEKKYQTDQQLFKDKVIAEAQLDQAKSQYLQSKKLYESNEKEMISNQITIAQLEGQVVGITTDDVQNRMRLLLEIKDSYKKLAAALDSWLEQYALRAPLDGKVSFPKNLSGNEFVNAGSDIMTIVPSGGNIYGQLVTPVTNSGKLAVGQKVLLKFDNFPYHEYGIVYGKVKAISTIPKDNSYNLEIELPQGLKTSYGKTLDFKQEMSGTAEIVTEDLRLLERIFYQVKKLLDKATN
jgi:HlyD family secretion protein